MKYYEDVADAKLADDFYEEFRHYVVLAASTPSGFTFEPDGSSESI